jgi:hypothetical protein
MGKPGTSKPEKDDPRVDRSPERRDALKALLQDRVDAHSLASFFDVTEISQGLWGLRGVAGNLQDLLQHLAADSFNHLPAAEIQNACKSILSLADEELKAIDRFLLERDQNSVVGQPAKGFYTCRPLHCLIWHQGARDTYESDYIRFKAYVLLAYRRLADGLIPLPEPDYPTAISFLPSCCLAARKLGRLRVKDDEERDILERLRANLPKTPNFEKYSKELVEQLKNFAVSAKGDVAINTLRVLKNLFEGRYPKKREPGEADDDDDDVEDVVIKPPKKPAPGPQLSKLEEIDDPSRPVLVTITPVDGKTPGGQLVRIRNKKKRFTTADDKFEYIAHRGRVNAIAMANQNLPWSWDRLSDYDVGSLRQYLADPALFATCMPPDSTVSSEELRAFLAYCFFSGRNSSTFCETSTLSRKAEQDDSTHYDAATGKLEFPTYEPQSSTRSGAHGSRPHTRHLSLRVHAEMKSAIHPWITRSVSAPTLGNTDPSTLETAADAWITRLKEILVTRLTLTRVKEHLFRTLAASLDSDEAIAVAITGNLQGGGYHPASYQALHPAVLQRHYDMVFGSDPVPVGLGVPLSESDPHVGSAKVPRTLAIRSLAHKLAHVLNLQAMHEYHQPFAEIHNTFAVYTYLLFGFSTGFRGTDNPIGHPAYFDPSTCELILSEKDRPNFSHCRPVWLPSVAVEQFRNYIDHLRHIENRLVILDPTLAGGNLATREAFPVFVGNRKENSDALAKSANYLFLIQAGGRREVLSPAAVNSWLKRRDLGTLHDNAWRQGYRTLLRESGCPDRVVRAAMGHWRTGEESFYRYSALLPEVYRSELDRHIGAVLGRMSWLPVVSPFVRQR